MEELPEQILCDIIKNITKTRIEYLLKIIHNNYKLQFPKNKIDSELIYILDNIKFITNASNSNENGNTNNSEQTAIVKLHSKKIVLPENRCNARIWNSLYFRDTGNKVDNIEKCFNVSDFNKIKVKKFNELYILGSQCKKPKKKNSNNIEQIYCGTHIKHCPHGNYFDCPSKEMIFHYLTDGNYIS
jgi:hypothetical protein